MPSHPPSHAAAPAPPAGPVPQRPTSLVGNLLRGALIGTAETVPGVSGGTVALVVGIYSELIGSASKLVSALRVLVTGPQRSARARAHLAAVSWRVLLPVGLGMVAAVVLVAGPMSDAVEQHPEQMRGLFLGMVLASVVVPVRMVVQAPERSPLAAGSPVRRSPWLRLLAGAAAAVVTWLLVSMSPAQAQPSPPVIVLAAAVAVSALVLPGLSGSFLLLTVGLYQPTLRAVADRDLGYLALFAVGAALGLALVVKVLQWLLTYHQTMTLSALAGLMVGGTRALWPWRDEANHLLAPGDDATSVLLLGAAGFAVVTLVVVADGLVARRAAREQAARLAAGG
ncbi:DUF368 domain-containing protein [Actinomyces wuliandei]|uniref:DUF368 domain-containing protein n=1 Tax=Actinomyces wuliandei TaxID=2057743 RepID=UPI0019D4A1BD|nr:DUF368 domain-containing protein [Actinomyces wuliandei]